MGASAYLAAKSQREVHEGEIAREKAEIEQNPDSARLRFRGGLPLDSPGGAT
jgi:hypothetical protein